MILTTGWVFIPGSRGCQVRTILFNLDTAFRTLDKNEKKKVCNSNRK